MDISYLWTGWTPVVHTALIATVGYLALVLMVRGTGPRTMAKMTPLDFVIAVTLGSTFGRTITAVDVSLAQALIALALLIALQWLLAAARARSPRVRKALDSPPVLLYYDGEMQHRALHRHRLTEDDVHAAARQSSRGSLADAKAVILQQDGSLGVISADAMGDGSSVMPFVERHAR
ncbi:DUF421 domain-containing protein [Georgenia satyanarayanai]|uniref:DUF421 domain-containing protein n=1 Tax=Georgenia satyanarayanai TaxID=860221 RepID=UPI00126470C7|nr:YetF domain-containing protein [Georgenia satyanarayanai]